MHKFLSLPLTLIIIKLVTRATILATIGTNVLFINAPPISAGSQAITLIDVPFVAAQSHLLLLTPPRLPHDGRPDPHVVPLFPLLPLVIPIHLALDPIDRATEIAPPFLTRMTQICMKTLLAMESSTA